MSKRLKYYKRVRPGIEGCGTCAAHMEHEEDTVCTKLFCREGAKENFVRMLEERPYEKNDKGGFDHPSLSVDREFLQQLGLEKGFEKKA